MIYIIYIASLKITWIKIEIQIYNLVKTELIAEQCSLCKIAIEKNRPVETDFRKYIPYFVMDIPDELCAKAGRSTYHDVSKIIQIIN